MPRRSILSTADRINLLALPDTADELIRHYTFSETDIADPAASRRCQSPGRRGAVVLIALPRPGSDTRCHHAGVPASMDWTATAHRPIVLAALCRAGGNPTLRVQFFPFSEATPYSCTPVPRAESLFRIRSVRYGGAQKRWQSRGIVGYRNN